MVYLQNHTWIFLAGNKVRLAVQGFHDYRDRNVAKMHNCNRQTQNKSTVFKRMQHYTVKLMQDCNAGTWCTMKH